MKTLLNAFLFTLLWASISTAAVYEAQEIPWSGYWWPHYAGELVNGYRSDSVPPFSKYDLVVSGTEKGSAYSCGNTYYDDDDALSWEGLCYCWAAAAINEEEPVSRGAVENVVFNVGDKKGLLTAMWDGSLYDIYDLSDPEDFHSLLETYIKEQETAVIINLGSLTDPENYSDEEWNFPVYKYDTSYSVYGDTRYYTTTIYFVLDNVEPDYVGSVIDSKTYQYYIETEGDIIIDSGWEGTNEDTPPLNMRIPYQVDPRCSALDPGTVRTIAGTVDDQFENNDAEESAAEISSGTFTLVAADKDWYTVDLTAGDDLGIDFDNEAGQEFLVYVYDTGDNITGYIENSGRIDLEADESGSYTIEVAADEGNSEDEPYYTMTVEKSLENSAFLPVVKKGDWENVLSLVTPGQENRQAGKAVLKESREMSCATADPCDVVFDICECTDSAHPFSANDVIGVRMTIETPGLYWTHSDSDPITVGLYKEETGAAADLAAENDTSGEVFSNADRVFDYTTGDTVYKNSDDETLTAADLLSPDSTTCTVAPDEQASILQTGNYVDGMGGSGNELLISQSDVDQERVYWKVDTPPVVGNWSELESIAGTQVAIRIALVDMSGQSGGLCSECDVVCEAYTYVNICSQAASDTERIFLTHFDENGHILSSVELEVDTPVIAGSLADSPFNMEIDTSGYLKIDSDQPLKGYGAVSDGDVRMYGTSAVQADHLRSDIFFTNYAASSGWSTVFSIINTGANEETVTYTAFNEEGEETETREMEMMPKEKFEFQPGDLDFSGSDTSAVIARTSSGRNVLAGFAEYTFEPSMIFYNGVALVNLNREPAQKMSLPHYASGSWFTGISVMNTSAWDDELLITAHDSDGQDLSETTVLVNARETFICEASSLFPDIDPEEMTSVSIVSGAEALLSGHAIYITSDYYKLAGVPLCPLPEGESAEPLVLPLSRWDEILYTGIALSNTGSDQMETDIVLYSETGSKIAETAVSLNPNARFASTLSAIFGESAISGAEGYVVVDPGNSQGLKGIYILCGEDTLFGDAF